MFQIINIFSQIKSSDDETFIFNLQTFQRLHGEPQT